MHSSVHPYIFLGHIVAYRLRYSCVYAENSKSTNHHCLGPSALICPQPGSLKVRLEKRFQLIKRHNSALIVVKVNVPSTRNDEQLLLIGSYGLVSIFAHIARMGVFSCNDKGWHINFISISKYREIEKRKQRGGRPNLIRDRTLVETARCFINSI